MGKLFNSNKTNEPVSERQSLEGKYASARSNLLLVVAFTVINIILLVTQSDTYFLFSAFTPYFVAGLGMILCGKYPSDFYVDDFAGMDIFGDSVFAGFLIVAGIITLMYLLCWIFSKKNRVGWLIFALVFFALDTLGMLLLGGLALESIVDIIFHGWVLFSLGNGIYVHSKLKKLPEEEIEPAAELEQQTNIGAESNEA